MTKDGYRNRIYAVEWHGNLWLKRGVARPRCEAMVAFCSECVDADYYGEPRPQTEDSEILRMQAYFDQSLFRAFNPRTDLVSFD